MMTNKPFATCLYVSCLLLAACQTAGPSSEPTPPAAQPADRVAEVPAITAAAAPEHAQPAAGMESIPAEEDFAEEAERSITATNLERELEQLEKELAADSP